MTLRHDSGSGWLVMRSVGTLAASSSANGADQAASSFAGSRSRANLVHCVDAGCSAADRRDAIARARLMVSVESLVTADQLDPLPMYAFQTAPL